jgi:hypothetical protein
MVSSQAPPFPFTMNYPHLINQKWLDNRADKKERRIVRLILKGCSNFRPFAVSGATCHKYLFTYDPKIAAHVLNVPESLWMEKNGAMAYDLMSKRKGNPLVVLILPYVKEKAAVKPLSEAIPTEGPTAEERALAALNA